jgi:hypothetical protein
VTEQLNDPLSTETPEQMFARALVGLDGGRDPQQLLDVADQHIDKWGRLAEDVAEGLPRDGRSNIYTGETYAEARDRWERYRDLLLDHLRGPDGVWH